MSKVTVVSVDDFFSTVESEHHLGPSIRHCNGEGCTKGFVGEADNEQNIRKFTCKSCTQQFHLCMTCVGNLPEFLICFTQELTCPKNYGCSFGLGEEEDRCFQCEQLKPCYSCEKHNLHCNNSNATMILDDGSVESICSVCAKEHPRCPGPESGGSCPMSFCVSQKGSVCLVCAN